MFDTSHVIVSDRNHSDFGKCVVIIDYDAEVGFVIVDNGSRHYKIAENKLEARASI